ncbi:urocanate hydratase [Cellulophaga sp. HaHaR_3_176]|uniref:urocanate hydratase n=1 Tax=Cellulophaga sp. HaHaR_3_176 TaxID=1942464 RepID=UPI001C1F2AD2|nr:urocanate hydratase [Cellulophaga sp. HaHaR_3_176]QWX83984.1 urocanate hydratase [Cellulophaga sp. HaHaR_3_176]
MTFKEQILQGLPNELPAKKEYNSALSHAPKRKDILSSEEKQLAIKNALRYFPKAWHGELAQEFAFELSTYGRIYMHRFKPEYTMYARPINEYPYTSTQAAGIMLMIQNNLDPAVAQHPEELITYGGNGAVFQNWAQYILTMQYLATMNNEQTLHMYSGHPMGLFPSSTEAPRVVATNGMMIPNYSKPDDWEKYNALGVTQYGQMTAGSYMYIGPQGIVHGTTITVMNAFRKVLKTDENPAGKIFLTAGLGGMSGAQPKAGTIAGCITICAEVNATAAKKRHEQGWVDVLVTNLDDLVARTKKAQEEKEVVSIAFIGNIVTAWERFYDENIFIHLGSDQTSLHNPWAGGYYPVDISFEEANELMVVNPKLFKEKVQESLRRQIDAINKHTAKGTYFFDYGNAFLLEASRAGAAVMAKNGIDFRYPSYVQDILGPMCFDYGFGPFRWVCTSGNPIDLQKTDAIAQRVLEDIKNTAPTEIQQQLQDNITWIKEANSNNLVVGSQARILYADAEGRSKIADAFNTAISTGEISAPIVLGRDHHDVSGTDSPFRETSNIYDGSKFTADMAIQNVIGDSFRGATWVSIHNGGGVGWGEVINGGFGMVIDGSKEAAKRLKSMLFYDVTNGIARRGWSRNNEALFAIQREMDKNPELRVTLPNLVDDNLLKNLF